MAVVPTQIKNDWLIDSATRLRQCQDQVLTANQKDVAAAASFGLTDAQTDRLRLDAARIGGIAAGLEQLAELTDPVGQSIEESIRPNGLRIEKIRVPLGVVFFVFESRPNVAADAAGICLKSGNAVILRGGKEAAHSNAAIIDVLRSTAQKYPIPTDALQLVSTADRTAVGHFLQMSEFIDLTIPRGGESLIRRVAQEATMPVIKHFSGNCHVYVDVSADLEMARNIIVNAKCQRMGVCNAAESLLVHEAIAESFLSDCAPVLQSRGIELRADPQAISWIPNAIPAIPSDCTTEYLGPILAVYVVRDCAAAIEHIHRYGSGHTDAIVAGDLSAIHAFTQQVDSSAVMVNASTRFHDGGEFGFGAEIGISTDKFHARGPCGLRELTSYKYVVTGSGQVRGD